MDDKGIIAALVDALEEAYIDRTIFTTMIMTVCENVPQLGGWELIFDKLKDERAPAVKQQFSALREAVVRSRDLGQALRQFLEDTSPKGPVH